MNKITVSAPGKLMLLGEHAVLYNHPCLVTAVDKRLYATVERIDKNEFQLEASDVGIIGYKKPFSKLGQGNIPKGVQFLETVVANFISQILKQVQDDELILQTVIPAKAGIQESTRFRIKSGMTKMRNMSEKTGVRVTTKSKFSSKLGFGSSSAITVCVVKAISELLNLNLTNKEIFDLSYKTVLDVQGKASGFDVAAAVYGGTLYFLTGGKMIEFLNINELPLVVAYSGIKADTVRMISKVKKDFANRQDRLDQIYNDIGILVNKGKEALVKMDWEMFGNLLNKNQNYLRELGVSLPKLDNMIKTVLDSGAYGAKISGAGGGDCMIAIASDEKSKRVEKAIEKAGGEIIDIRTNAEGVTIE